MFNLLVSASPPPNGREPLSLAFLTWKFAAGKKNFKTVGIQKTDHSKNRTFWRSVFEWFEYRPFKMVASLDCRVNNHIFLFYIKRSRLKMSVFQIVGNTNTIKKIDKVDQSKSGHVRFSDPHCSEHFSPENSLPERRIWMVGCVWWSDDMRVSFCMTTLALWWRRRRRQTSKATLRNKIPKTVIWNIENTSIGLIINRQRLIFFILA